MMGGVVSETASRLRDARSTPLQGGVPEHRNDRGPVESVSGQGAVGHATTPAPRVGLVAACAFPAPRGSQVLVQEMASAMDTLGMEVHLIAPLDRRARHRSYPTHAVSPAVPRARAGGPTGILRPLVDLSLIGRLLQVTRSEGLEVLHAHNYEGLAASLAVRAICGVPVVYHSHNVFSDELPTYLPAITETLGRQLGVWCDRTLPRLADRVITLSGDVAQYLVECGVEPGNLSVIPPGLDSQPFEGFRRETRAPRCIFTGNLDGYQNLELLLDAWDIVESRCAEGELVLLTHVRRGRAARRLRARLRGGRVRLRVVHSLTEVAEELGQAMVGISPRASWSGFPIKTLNYMACGLPTVALASSAKGVEDGETGWIVPQQEPAALASAISEALASPGECARRGQAALHRLRTVHGWEALAPRILKVSRSARDAVAANRNSESLPPGLTHRAAETMSKNRLN